MVHCHQIGIYSKRSQDIFQLYAIYMALNHVNRANLKSPAGLGGREDARQFIGHFLANSALAGESDVRLIFLER